MKTYANTCITRAFLRGILNISKRWRSYDGVREAGGFLLSTGQYNTSGADKTHCIIRHFVRSYQKGVTSDQYGLLGNLVLKTAAATSLRKHHIRGLSVVVATLTGAGAQGDKSTRSKHTLTLSLPAV